jgi:hypothetical protein
VALKIGAKTSSRKQAEQPNRAMSMIELADADGIFEANAVKVGDGIWGFAA